MKLLEKFRGIKTYGSVILSALACVALYFAGADTNSIVLVGLGGLLGGTAGLRSALNNTKMDAEIKVVKQIVDAGDALFDEPQGGKPHPLDPAS